MEGADEDDIEVNFDTNDGDVAIDATLTNSSWCSHRQLRAKYDVIVPLNYQLDVDTSGGSARVNPL
jgi:hypothetical protein